jgi:hypothetical protein
VAFWVLLISLLKYERIGIVHYMALGRIWQHAKFSYGVGHTFAHNSENFQKSFKIDKCEHFSNARIWTQAIEKMYFTSQGAG